jgi:WD40 repeat protein/energy-coupling factor transporter ATP-binding protein EcfA2
MALKTSSKNSIELTNPFPGLRPFTRQESHLFFGREGQIENVAENLVKNKFVAVIGSSGSGKSSLIYCGVLSKIMEKGKWNLVLTRPGSNPFKNLLDSTSQTFGINTETTHTTDIEKYPEYVIQILKQSYKKSKSECLIVIDQFEELFRFRLASKEDDTLLSRSLYADLLVKLVEQKEIPVNIIITMRSDFIGECSRFQDFTSLINKSNYLIPRMSRDNFKRVIVEPVKIAGASISEELVEKILNEMGDNQDQLPILQHALMRTWSYWKENSTADKAIGINDYEATGGIFRALSDHANEAFDDLNQEEKQGCERIFRSLTEKGSDNRGVRRPTSVKELSKISELPEEKVIKIVDVFRAEGRSFLTPSIDNRLDSNSVIDLSHEALMRIWDKLNNWVDEESAAVSMYKRLSESAALYQHGKSGLWRPPDLHLASNWKNKNNPNLAWAERHDPAFERTMVFLNTSEKEFEKEEENKLRLQKLRLRRTRMFALVLGSAAIISLVMFLYTRQLSVDLELQVNVAETERIKAQEATKAAEEQAEIAQLRFEEANYERARADTARTEAEIRRQEAERNANIARVQTNIATERQKEADEQRNIALENERIANIQRDSAELARREAYSRRMLSIANSMSIKSLQINDDNDLQALLVLQAYKFNDQYEGEKEDGDIYYGLYNSLKSILGFDFNSLKAHQNAVKTIASIPGTNSFVSAGSDGMLLRWDINNSQMDSDTLAMGRRDINTVDIASSGDFMLGAENRMGLFYLDLKASGAQPVIFQGQDMNIRSIAISNDNKTAYTAGLKNIIELWDINNRSSEKYTETESRVNALTISPDGKVLAGGLENGKTLLWFINRSTDAIKLDSIQDNIHSITYTPDGKFLLCGTEKGVIRIYNMDNFKLEASLSGHNSRVTSIAVSGDGQKMVSTSFDNRVLFWNMNDLTSPPIVFTDNNGFGYAAAFSSDGKYFITGSRDESRLIIRPSTADILTAELSPLISRNMTGNEWVLYVAEDIPFEKTIINE